MLTFLFWNLKRKNLAASVARLVLAHSVDILILAEADDPSISSGALLPLLNNNSQLTFYYSPDRCSRIEIYSRFTPSLLRPVTEDSHYTIRRMNLPNRNEILLAAAHLPSKRDNSPNSQYDHAIPLCNDIYRTEGDAQHKRTIVVGDLNMNPFEYGVISARRFHAVSSKIVAQQEKRVIAQEEFTFFYNPVWRFFGDRREHPPGTYYYRKAVHDCYFWNIFDQVLVRPALLNFWDDRNLHILTGDGEENYLSRRSGTPGGTNGSDHLPLLFRLNL